ncbi:hypothetical protein M9H77_12565 [Catharanthus roseus]|uniref:Uncharacterized protein n=1 Tax=Catharanthus roseus TaxID=4058 RepID=A0ACC0BHT3_CATRO|nr:hypothetical protein M9H77_12565 [Catharanthus roseus]
MRVSSAAGKSDRIKTHQHSLYTRIQRNTQCHSRVRRTMSGSHNEVIEIKFRNLVVNTNQTPYERSITKQPLSRNWPKQATDSWGTYQVYPRANLSFKPLLALHKAVVPPQSMMPCPHRSIGTRPPWYYALFK